MQIPPVCGKSDWQNILRLSTLAKFQYIRHIAARMAYLYLIFFAVISIFSTSIASPAFSVDLEGDPYIKTPPYQPPPLPISPTTPLGGNERPSRAESHAPYNPPYIDYHPRSAVNPSKAAQHDLWCRQNHPSYRATDNTYRSFDRSGTMPAQTRIPCVSPYD